MLSVEYPHSCTEQLGLLKLCTTFLSSHVHGDPSLGFGFWFLLYRAVCVDSELLFDLPPLDFCSGFDELSAACSVLL